MEQSRSPVKTINAMKARQNFGQMLEEVYYKGDQFVVERAGKPMAAVVPVWQLEEWQKERAHSSKSSKRKPKIQAKQKML
jgi:prevent-host-death family protein